jgi:hypothetical protein
VPDSSVHLQAVEELERRKTNMVAESMKPSELKSLCKIRTGRRFELQELCGLFVGKPAAVFCTILITVYLFDWTTVVIACTALAVNAPVGDSGTFRQCSEKDFQYNTHPVGGCWNTYTLTVLVFGMLALFIALAELGELKLLQTVLAVVRFTTVGAMILYSIIAEAVHKEDAPSGRIPLLQFSFNGWLTAIPVLVYANLTHVSIPTISDPVANKEGLLKMWAGVFFTTSVFGAVLGVTVAIHFKSDVNEVASLNWVCDVSIN